MFIRSKLLGAKRVSVVAVLCLAACVTPERKVVPTDDPVPTQGAPAPLPVLTSPAHVQAPPEYRQYMEAQLLCPTKSFVDVQGALKRSIASGLISGKGRANANYSDPPIYFDVAGDLSVFGFKVVGLEFEGTLQGEGALYAYIDATPEAVSKMFKSRHITMRKSKSGPYYVSKRPYDQFVTFEKKGNLMRIGCFIPID